MAAGVRRIEAVCGEAAEEFVSVQLEQIRVIREGRYKNPKDLSKAIENLQKKNTALKNILKSLEARQLVVLKKRTAAER